MDLIKLPNPIDRHVGGRVRMRRMLMGMSQQRLGHALGLTFQQVQKYEKGSNRIGASWLQQISTILEVPVEFFFEGAPRADGTLPGGFGEPSTPSYEAEFLSTAEGVQLMRAFIKVRNAQIRRRVVDLVEALGAEQGESSSAR